MYETVSILFDKNSIPIYMSSEQKLVTDNVCAKWVGVNRELKFEFNLVLGFPKVTVIEDCESSHFGERLVLYDGYYLYMVNKKGWSSITINGYMEKSVLRDSIDRNIRLLIRDYMDKEC